jgi:hypothetical protein
MRHQHQSSIDRQQKLVDNSKKSIGTKHNRQQKLGIIRFYFGKREKEICRKGDRLKKDFFPTKHIKELKKRF